MHIFRETYQVGVQNFPVLTVLSGTCYYGTSSSRGSPCIQSIFYPFSIPQQGAFGCPGSLSSVDLCTLLSCCATPSARLRGIGPFRFSFGARKGKKTVKSRSGLKLKIPNREGGRVREYPKDPIHRTGTGTSWAESREGPAPE